MLTCLDHVLFTFYIQDVLKLKKKNNDSGAKGLILRGGMGRHVSDCSGSGCGGVASICECGTERSDSM